METVLISVTLRESKKSEFFQTMESLKILVKNYCNDFQITTVDELSLEIQITFNDIEDVNNNFYGNEFKILKGSLRSVCENFMIKINGLIIN